MYEFVRVMGSEVSRSGIYPLALIARVWLSDSEVIDAGLRQGKRQGISIAVIIHSFDHPTRLSPSLFTRLIGQDRLFASFDHSMSTYSIQSVEYSVG